MITYLYDIESFPNYFCATFEELKSKKQHYFEISEYRNDFEDLVNFYDSINNEDNFVVSFNGLSYDNIVLNYIMLFKVKDAKSIKKFSDFVINNKSFALFNFLVLEELSFVEELREKNSYRISKSEDKKDELKKIVRNSIVYCNKWIDIDLYLHWSFGLRITKKISLKSLGIQLNYPVVQELPYPHDKVLTKKEIENVKNYNTVHDITLLRYLMEKDFYWQGKKTNMKQQLKLRWDFWKSYGLSSSVMSWDAPKIASELMLLEYCKATEQNTWSIKRNHQEKPYTFTQPLKLVDPKFKTKQLQDLFKRFEKANQTNDRSFSEEFVFNLNNTCIKISVGVGGIHTVNNNEYYESDDKTLVITSDIASLYPNSILNYKAIRQKEVLKKYNEIKDERIKAKKAKIQTIETKSKNVSYKLILNGMSGLLDSPHNWMYYPEGMMKVRLMGQLILLKTVEELALNRFKVVSVNTDGEECIVERDKTELYYEIVNNVGKQFNLEYEHEIYKFIAYSNINNYTCQTIDGNIKEKGILYNTTANLGDSCNAMIVQKAIKEYWHNNTPIKEYITRKDHSIFDFCISKKVGRPSGCDEKYFVYHGNTKLSQRLNRYFVSVKGKMLFKQHPLTKKKHNLLKGWGVEIYNNHVEKSIEKYNIDYRYYIKEANKIINEVKQNSINQLKLF